MREEWPPVDLRLVFKSGAVVDLVVDSATADLVVAAFMAGTGRRAEWPDTDGDEVYDHAGARVALDPSALAAAFERRRV